MKQDKPLKDWTLGEVKEYCIEQADCKKCCFRQKEYIEADVCAFDEAPQGWNLTDRSRFTDSEIEAAKAILTLWPEADTVARQNGYNPIFEEFIDDCIRVYVDDKHAATLDVDIFPSLERGGTVRLKDIIGGK